MTRAGGGRMADLFDVVAATWPAAGVREMGGFVLRRGEGGGNRASAATRAGGPADITLAEAGMRDWGQVPLFLLRPGEAALDAELAARGYLEHDASRLLSAPVAALATPDPERRVVACDAPLRVMARLWQAGGIGPARLAVMARAAGPRTWLMIREGDRVAGCGFVAVREGIAMLHALEIDPAFRRRGLGTVLTRGAARWAEAVGAADLALAVTTRNAAAGALYAGLGMTEGARYHYRRAPDPGGSLPEARGSTTVAAGNARGD